MVGIQLLFKWFWTIPNSLWKEPRQMELKRIPPVHGSCIIDSSYDAKIIEQLKYLVKAAVFGGFSL
jgi:hypothetical protein